MFVVRRRTDKQTDADIEALDENLGLKKSKPSKIKKMFWSKEICNASRKISCRNTKPNKSLSNVQFIKKNYDSSAH